MKNFLIVFPCDTLAYSPTMLNMTKMLSEAGSVDMATLWEKRNESAARKLKCRFFYVRIPSLIRRVLQRMPKLYNSIKAFLLSRTLRRHKDKEKDKYDLIFAVDSLGYCVARQVYTEDKNVIYVSLEICDDSWLAMTKKIGVNMLLIQSELRKQFLFGDAAVPFRILPNSNMDMPPAEPRKRSGSRLIYMGAIYPVHGVEFCINALYALPEEL